MDLTQKHCIPCEGGTPPLTREEITKYAPDAPGWEIVDNKKISREFRFKDFTGAMKFINSVAAIAEAEGHHPDIYIFYNLVRLELSTHAVNGLSENDFILAAKINRIT
ncbi:MAG: 4a-hydroxytetrahydrobiopterin dehydratase [Patescibacteria group bacterium]|nr:4a-hydroxytetrahydrobiopterin dehydratase [Patescibacteria group bacterium]MDE2014921.1 4a-hydroxytetrahydrobiopterin dehydratase [Patescibacteria group bacterium]MDE2226350.1 4a-hydroxytetrahydrobiopterin dehydratase [Patescibacteria group bacterium]